MLSGLGLTMTGARPGGFGALNDKTNEICGTGDLICAAPEEAFSVANLPNTLNTLAGGAGQPVHALYATPQFWNMDGQPAHRLDVELGARAHRKRATPQTWVTSGPATLADLWWHGRDQRYLGFGLPRGAP